MCDQDLELIKMCDNFENSSRNQAIVANAISEILAKNNF